MYLLNTCTARHWSREGLVTLPSYASGDGVACQAYHLTAFSVLLDPLDEPLDEAHAHALSILTYVGLALSSLALAITIFTYMIFK